VAYQKAAAVGRLRLQTLWDWLQLLIIPAVLAGVGLWFNSQQRAQELQTAIRRAQDEALQAYLNQMSEMLLPSSKDLPSLYKAHPGDRLSSVARARTLTVLLRLGDDGKAQVVQFLYESGLIARDHPILALNWANLRGVALINTNLSGANLSGANLYRAILSGSLRKADLSGAILDQAYLQGVDLSGANLGPRQLSEAELRWARARGHYLPGHSRLVEADLRGADLSGAILSGALLESADLRYANLTGVVGVTPDKLAELTSLLEGATMPNGQKYEDWLKGRE
jgi:uncharacterized protein YjbI with pentapeptide repeats